jgi:hypothetical protein
MIDLHPRHKWTVPALRPWHGVLGALAVRRVRHCASLQVSMANKVSVASNEQYFSALGPAIWAGSIVAAFVLAFLLSIHLDDAMFWF